MTAQRIGFACWAALIALHTLWLTWWAPPANGAIGIALAVALIPLLLPLLLLNRQPARALLWVGILCLFYFCHGIAAAWGEPRARVPALLEIVLCVALIGALGWGARGYRRKR
jgi:uncharacterized membrane protein